MRATSILSTMRVIDGGPHTLMQDIRPQLHEFGLHISHERVRVSEDTASVLEVAAGDSGRCFHSAQLCF